MLPNLEDDAHYPLHHVPFPLPQPLEALRSHPESGDAMSMVTQAEPWVSERAR